MTAPKRAETRAMLVGMIVEQIKQNGYASVQAEDLRGQFDDPPEGILLYFLRMEEEVKAKRENRRPQILPPKTLADDLKEACKANGWKIQRNPRTYMHEIVAPLKRVECKECGGTGRIRASAALLPVNLSDTIDFGAMMTYTIATCIKCRGNGHFDTRKAV